MYSTDRLTQPRVSNQFKNVPRLYLHGQNLHNPNFIELESYERPSIVRVYKNMEDLKNGKIDHEEPATFWPDY